MAAGERDLFRDSVRSFVEAEVSPNAEELDRHGVFPEALFERMGELGFFGLRYPPDNVIHLIFGIEVRPCA